MDRLARQLRNLASPTIFTEDYQAQPNAIDVASDYDFVFRVVDDVRPGGQPERCQRQARPLLPRRHDPERGRSYQQQQTWKNRASNDPPELPSLAGCPATRMDTTRSVSAGHVNRSAGRDRPLFVFNSADPRRSARSTPSSTWILTRRAPPNETRLASGVTLRNQNRAPVARLYADRPAGSLC